MSEQLITGGKAIDVRGSVSFVNEFNFTDVKRFYQIHNHNERYIRAWHGHIHEAKYVFVNAGTFLIGITKLKVSDNNIITMDEEYGVHKYILSAEQPKILYIPNGHANGFMNLTQENVITFYSTSTLEQSKGDDYRFDHDYSFTTGFWDKTFF